MGGPRRRTKPAVKVRIEQASGDGQGARAPARLDCDQSISMDVSPPPGVGPFATGSPAAVVPSGEDLLILVGSTAVGRPPRRIGARLRQCIAQGYEFTGEVTGSDGPMLQVTVGGRLKPGATP